MLTFIRVVLERFVNLKAKLDMKIKQSVAEEDAGEVRLALIVVVITVVSG